MYSLPKLKYGYGDLEPYIDAKTMEIHHSKHHQAYIDKLNKALEAHSDLQVKNINEIIESLDSLPAEIKPAVQNNGGGHFNHSFFWEVMTPGGSKPSENLLQKINHNFGSFDNFRDKFGQIASQHFGSGWAWLVASNDKLEILSTANQDCPLSAGKTPLLGLDIWEHAYYLKYQNRRPEYVEAWWNVVNWTQVEANLNGK